MANPAAHPKAGDRGKPGKDREEAGWAELSGLLPRTLGLWWMAHLAENVGEGLGRKMSGESWQVSPRFQQCTFLQSRPGRRRDLHCVQRQCELMQVILPASTRLLNTYDMSDTLSSPGKSKFWYLGVSLGAGENQGLLKRPEGSSQWLWALVSNSKKEEGWTTGFPDPFPTSHPWICTKIAWDKVLIWTPEATEQCRKRAQKSQLWDPSLAFKKKAVC